MRSRFFQSMRSIMPLPGHFTSIIRWARESTGVMSMAPLVSTSTSFTHSVAGLRLTMNIIAPVAFESRSSSSPSKVSAQAPFTRTL